MSVFDAAYSHRHLHDFLVGRNELISHLLKQFERKLRSLGSERHAVDITGAARQQVHSGGFCALLRALHLVDDTSEHVAETDPGVAAPVIPLSPDTVKGFVAGVMFMGFGVSEYFSIETGR